jgi:hypothetical protein
MFGRAAGFDRVATNRRPVVLTRARERRVVEARQDWECETLACECSDPSCREPVAITAEEREFVQRVPNRRVVRVGHADIENERVLMEEPGRFQVVERF